MTRKAVCHGENDENEEPSKRLIAIVGIIGLLVNVHMRCLYWLNPVTLFKKMCDWRNSAKPLQRKDF